MGLNLIDALCITGLTKSKSEARRLIIQGGVYVNNCRITDIDRQLTPADLINESMILLRTGKKNYFMLKFTNHHGNSNKKKQ